MRYAAAVLNPALAAAMIGARSLMGGSRAI